LAQLLLLALVQNAVSSASSTLMVLEIDQTDRPMTVGIGRDVRTTRISLPVTAAGA
jgi:hypothetical protein